MLELRNPFPKLLKVFKYEFIFTSKTLVPLFAILLLLGFLTGISLDPQKFDLYDNSNSTIEHDFLYNDDSYNSDNNYKNYEETNFHTPVAYYNINNEPEIIKSKKISAKIGSTLTGILFFLFYTLLSATAIITIVMILNRYKKSMLGDEAYLNLTLPVTIGEHLWGRFLSAFVWLLLGSILTFISAILATRKIFKFLYNNASDIDFQFAMEELSEFSQKINLPLSIFILIIAGLVGISLLISALYLILTLSNMVKKHKKICFIVIGFIFMSIYIRIIGSFFINYAEHISKVYNDISNFTFTFIKPINRLSLINFIIFICTMEINHFLLSKKLNLE